MLNDFQVSVYRLREDEKDEGGWIYFPTVIANTLVTLHHIRESKLVEGFTTDEQLYRERNSFIMHLEQLLESEGFAGHYRLVYWRQTEMPADDASSQKALYELLLPVVKKNLFKIHMK